MRVVMRRPESRAEVILDRPIPTSKDKYSRLTVPHASDRLSEHMRNTSS